MPYCEILKEERSRAFLRSRRDPRDSQSSEDSEKEEATVLGRPLETPCMPALLFSRHALMRRLLLGDDSSIFERLDFFARASSRRNTTLSDPLEKPGMELLACVLRDSFFSY
jgi:hypothetical protein